MRPERAVYRSPGLWGLLSRLSETESYRILDLGPAVGPNVEYFSRFSCRIRIADLFRSIAADPGLAERSREDPEAAFEELFPLEQGPFDLILVWDLFNYLDRGQLRALAGRLARLCPAGGRLLAFLSTAPEIPAEPVSFKIADPGLVLYEVSTPRTRRSPGYSPGEIEHTLGGFAADRVFLLRHGVQEYLFVRRGNAPAVTRDGAQTRA